jgi:trigger factor
LKSEILSQEKNVVVIKAEYESGEVDAAVHKTVRQMSNKANIKGFRKGHVPRKTLELMLGKNSIYRETLEKLAGEALENVVSEYDLNLVVDPKLKLGELNEGNSLAIEFTFEVRPEVNLPDISALSAEKTVYSVSDDEVDEGLRQILESNARLEPLEDDREAEKDDIVDTLYSSYRVQDDGHLKSLEKDKKSTLYLSTLRQDIAEAIIGHRPAEKLSFDIRLEDDYPDRRMAGTAVRYELEILNFMKRVVPEADDATIAEISQGKYQSVEEIRTDIRKQLEESASARSEASLQESAIKALAEAAEIDVPETMIDRQYLAMRREHDNQLQRSLKQSLDDYLTDNNLSVEKFDGSIRKHAEETVRNTLALDALAERDEISFTNDDVNEEIIRMANSMRMNPQELADTLSANRKEFANLTARVRTRNTVKHLAALVKVTETAVEHHHGDEHEHRDENEERAEALTQNEVQ